MYDTVPNVTNQKALEMAIKQVWASIWNVRAVDEREHFGIPHTQVYPAVLVQLGVNAMASGVLITKDLWGHQPRTYTINAKWGLGMRVVEGQRIPEQVLYDTGNAGTRILSRSDESTMLVFDDKGGVKEVAVPASNAIMTEARANSLGKSAEAISRLFPEQDALDIEWVLDQDKFWIVQARPYITGR